MDEFVYGIIRERRKEPREILATKTDLLSRFICLENEKNEHDEEQGKEEKSQEREEEIQKFSDKYLRDIILNFFIAGRDTTGILLTWTFYLLSQHPECEEKVFWFLLFLVFSFFAFF